MNRSNALPIGTSSMSSISHAEKLKQGALLLNSFELFLGAHAEISDIHQCVGNDQKLRILCYQVSEFPAIMNVINAANISSDPIFERALFCSWFSFLIADQFKLSVVTTKELFVAGLVQHLPEVKDGGEKGVVSTLPDTIQQLILDGREKYDGTGPSGKYENQLPQTSQILIVTNDIVGQVYGSLSHFSDRHSNLPESLTFSSTLPILRLNASVYFRLVYCQAVRIIDFSRTENIEFYKPASADKLSVSAILDTQNSLLLRWPHLVNATAELISFDESGAVFTLRSITRRAWMLVTTAGILSDDISLWLSSVDEEEVGAYQEITELNILLQELGNMVCHFHALLEELIQNQHPQMSDDKRSRLSDLCIQLVEPEETFDLEEFTLVNMCD